MKAAKALLLIMSLSPTLLLAQDETVEPERTQTMSLAVPDLRDEDVPLKAQNGDFVFVPIPISNPTFGSGLVAAGAYFQAQTEEQKKVQPASMTGLGGVYTDNESFAVALVQQSYWDENRWRLNAVAGYVDFSLTLSAPDDDGGQTGVDWEIVGELVQFQISRKLGTSNWYGGLLARYIDMNQNIDATLAPQDFDVGDSTQVVGLGAVVEYDHRSRPINSQSGNYFKFDAIFSGTSADGDNTYSSLSADYRSYHPLSDSLVFAWQAKGCSRDGNVPLWNACFIGLRGFSATEYIGRQSASGQTELRWSFNERWGAVAFAGAGWAGESFAEQGDDQNTKSYGIGGRFMVLKSQGINIRVDYAWSDNDQAVYLSVAEAF